MSLDRRHLLLRTAALSSASVVLLVGEDDADAAAKIIESYRQSPPVDDETAEISG